jgi:hypothetical protein
VEVHIHAHRSLFYGVAVLAQDTILSALRRILGPFIPLYLAGFAYLIWRAWRTKPLLALLHCWKHGNIRYLAPNAVIHDCF